MSNHYMTGGDHGFLEREWNYSVAEGYEPGHPWAAPTAYPEPTDDVKANRVFGLDVALPYSLRNKKVTREIVARALETAIRARDKERELYARLRSDALHFGENCPFCLRSTLSLAHNHFLFANSQVDGLQRWLRGEILPKETWAAPPDSQPAAVAVVDVDDFQLQ